MYYLCGFECESVIGIVWECKKEYKGMSGRECEGGVYGKCECVLVWKCEYINVSMC